MKEMQMKLNKTYAIGVLVQFYEVEMFEDYIDGLFNMLQDVENPENITLNFVFNIREDFERVDTSKKTHTELTEMFNKQIDRIADVGVSIETSVFNVTEGSPPAIAWYRRDFNYHYAGRVDYLMWGETDSFFPKETFQILERIALYAEEQKLYKHVVTFAYRKMWDVGWSVIEHPEFVEEKFEDTDEWNLNNKASEKCYMSIDEMNEINARHTENDNFNIVTFASPKFDGSCVVFSAELIKAGVNIPHSLLMSGEDTSLGWVAQQIMGENYIQFHASNVLRVHNRRHPKKRLYVVGENNPKGFCGEKDKGKWWRLLETMSKQNLHSLNNPRFKFHTWKDFFREKKLLEGE
jgi:hypothetical protein